MQGAASAGAAASSHVQALDRMMIALGPESARDAATIKRVYRDHLELLLLDEYTDLEGALANGGVAPLPSDPGRFNLTPRLEGAHPIGEKDLTNQDSYLAARPATIGVLLALASGVRSGPLEITSLVRHGEYQSALRTTNHNASTSVPMHTMGLAFDIALVNTPIKAVYEIRDALRRMRAAGDILFIGERKQLVFHVVPHPSRLGHFNDVYTRALGAPPATQATVVIAQHSATTPRRAGTPSVVTEVVSIAPGDERDRIEWSSALEPGPAAPAAAALSSAALSTAALSSNAGVTLGLTVLARSLLALVAAVAAAAFRIFAS
jgi:hypothetical protein